MRGARERGRGKQTELEWGGGLIDGGFCYLKIRA